jgi:trimethylamine:corrinoid methyltransferase-like protein
MSKADKFIQDCTRNCSNLFYRDYVGGFDKTVYQSWLTPVQAKEAVEIARKEIYEWLANHYRDYMHNPTGKKLEAFFGMDMINDLKQAMNDEEIK